MLPPPTSIPNRPYGPIYQQQQQQQQPFGQRVPPGMIQHRSNLPMNSLPVNPANVINRVPIIRNQASISVNSNMMTQTGPSMMQQNSTMISSKSQKPQAV